MVIRFPVTHPHPACIDHELFSSIQQPNISFKYMTLGVDSIIFIDGRVVINTPVMIKGRKYTYKKFRYQRDSMT